MTSPQQPTPAVPDQDGQPPAHRPAPADWRDVLPWQGRASRGDKALVITLLGVTALMALTIPFRPFLLASHPVLLELATGSLSAVGAGAAFARVGEAQLWLVVVAGVVGMIKLDWLFWLAGRRWGARVIALFAPGDRAARLVERLRTANPWLVRLAVVAGALPGIPAAAVYCLAGLNRMRLGTFLLFDAIGALLMVGLVTGLGYGLGQHAVDVVLLVDEHALWVSLGLVVVVAFLSARRTSAQTRTPADAPTD
ncbi:DedA family protein [Auraticoccus sp. F435]|uniref:DedA family protein n=1 Tax=Auraticoccus cholistanensis TaxID=2656650 RepID=A0A6A9UYN8_9ACTN|nr:DedA family protein [Auraticoccus cholistanensis]MVA77002.1 DedA family protein [Auraticoccus cholistanensis]